MFILKQTVSEYQRCSFCWASTHALWLFSIIHKLLLYRPILNIKHFAASQPICSYCITNLFKSVSTPAPPISSSRSSLVLAPCGEESPSLLGAPTSASTGRTLKTSLWSVSLASIAERSTLSPQGESVPPWCIYAFICTHKHKHTHTHTFDQSIVCCWSKSAVPFCQLLETLSTKECFVFPWGDLVL